MLFYQLFEPGLAQYTYIIACDQTKRALVVDPGRDLTEVWATAKKHGLTIEAVTETHIHADYLSGVQTCCQQYGLTAFLSSYGKEDGWQYQWPNPDDPVVWLSSHDKIHVGELSLEVLHTPGHTPEHLVFKVYDGQPDPVGVLTGDFIMVGDLGRPDLLEKAANEKGHMQKGAEQLYDSVQSFLKHPKHLILWPGHGAGSSCGKSLGSRPYTTLGYELAHSSIIQQQSKSKFCQSILSGQKDPPAYFARMKKANRDGRDFVPNYRCSQLHCQNFKAFEKILGLGLCLDITGDKVWHFNQRFQSLMWAPLSSLATAVGSLLDDDTMPLVLLGSVDQVAKAQKLLTMIGYDHVVGYVTKTQVESWSDYQASPIRVIDFKQWFDLPEKDDWEVLDVRTTPEFNQDALPYAVHKPYQRLALQAKQLSTSKRYVIYCQSGARASLVASFLATQGHQLMLIDDAKS